MWTYMWKYIYEINQVKAKFYVLSLYVVYHTPIEKFEDTKEVIRSHQSKKTDNTMAKRRTMIYKPLHRELKIGQHEPH
jgi:hypothetical protein